MELVVIVMALTWMLAAAVSLCPLRHAPQE